MRLAISRVGVAIVFLAGAPLVRAQTTPQSAPPTGNFGPAIQFDTKGVEFGPWIRLFVSQLKRNWLIPIVATTEKGHVVVAFDIHKDGTITDVKIETPSAVAAFNDSARSAIAASNPTQPLPQEYPDALSHFVATFYYNESPDSTPQTSASQGVSTASGSNASTSAPGPSPEFRADIRRLMEVSGAAALSVQLGNLLAGAVADSIKRSHPNVPDRAVAIIKEVVGAEMVRELTTPDGIQEQLVDLYARHFTQDEIKALVAFYGTPIGQKALTAMPLMMRDSMAIGQKWAAANSPRIVGILQERLRAEGLIK